MPLLSICSRVMVVTAAGVMRLFVGVSVAIGKLINSASDKSNILFLLAQEAKGALRTKVKIINVCLIILCFTSIYEVMQKRSENRLLDVRICLAYNP